MREYNLGDIKQMFKMKRRGAIANPKFEMDRQYGQFKVTEYMPNGVIRVLYFAKNSNRKWEFVSGTESTPDNLHENKDPFRKQVFPEAVA